MVQASRPQVPLLRSLEGLRLIASLGIVSIHMLPHVGLSPPDGLNLLVDMFFVISGIVIGHLYAGRIASIRDYATFVRRRLARIYPLHLATLLFYIAIGAGIARLHMAADPGRFDTGKILPNLLLVQAWGHGTLAFNFVAWSISAEFLLYLVFPLLAVLVARSFLGGFLAVLALLGLAILWAECVFGTRLYLLHWDYGAVRAFPSFAFGVWLAASAPRLLALRGARWSPVAFMLASLLAFLEITTASANYLLLVTLYAVVAAAFLSDMQTLPTLAAWRPLSARGYLTYSLYMLHVPVATVFLSFVFPRILGHGDTAQWCSIIASLAILFGLSELSFRKFEDPARRLLR